MHPDVAEVRRLLGRLGLEISAVVPEAENAEYGAFVFHVGRGFVRLRVGKLTPTKAGLFVSAWKRSQNGSTEPFAGEEHVDLLVIIVREGSHVGQFAFPRSALVEHGIVSVNGRGGKRGFRVYPPWSTTKSGQARHTQKWQCEYFLDHDEDVDLRRAHQLFHAVS